MADFGLVDSFHIDHGELDGLSPQECFVLGVEWSAAYALVLSDGEPTQERLIHHRNAERLTALCEKYGRFCEYIQDTDEWGRLFIGTKKGKRVR